MIKNKDFDLDAYLNRLNFDTIIHQPEDCLEALQRAQLFAIPFENFDILLGRGISLEPATIFDKLVRRKRGGYCFELNGLFLMALHALGFKARPLLARVHKSGTPSGRGHQISLVQIQGKKWIADVGFGFPYMLSPIPLELNHQIKIDGQTFRLMEAEPFGIMLQNLKEDQWQNQYSFDLGHVCPADIAYGNHYTSTNPNSFFTFDRVAALPNPNGRVSLYNLTLKKVTGNTEQMEKLEEGELYLEALKNHFNIKLDASYEELRPLSLTNREKKPDFEL